MKLLMHHVRFTHAPASTHVRTGDLAQHCCSCTSPLSIFLLLDVCSKQVIQLEQILSKRLAQLSILEAENAQLKQKEWALQSCILGIEGSVAATRAALEVEINPQRSAGNISTHNSEHAESHSTASNVLLGGAAAAGASGLNQFSSSLGSTAQVSSGTSTWHSNPSSSLWLHHLGIWNAPCICCLPKVQS
jgi:hypothetical protein